ncbi:Glycoside hydrolase [Theobroma cacao]|nr:Glycoside hydrolase [Theobroma cacao]
MTLNSKLCFCFMTNLTDYDYMATCKQLFLILLIQCILLAESCDQDQHNIFDVIHFGAIGDGANDDTEAFKHAWDAVCGSSVSSPTFVVPGGKTFVLQPLTFNGQCNSTTFTFQAIISLLPYQFNRVLHLLVRMAARIINGTIIAPSNPSEWKCNDKNCHQWITFEHFDGLSIQGSGTINGQGTNWWTLSCEDNEELCDKKATGFVIAHSNNVQISELTFEDSPKVHISLERSTLINATRLTIQAPGDSPNTDGIHIQHSTNVSIDQSLIQTGDDCVSIGDGSSYIDISNINCGPGHGISIGSLGRNGHNESVEFVHVRDVSFNRSTNGVRIKTWQGGHGHVRNITFERITSHGARRPIIIDQYYCPHDHCSNETSAVEIDNVAYSQIEGTTDRETAVQLACSESTPCTNIFMKDINLRYEEDEEKTSSYCLNAQGLRNGRVSPNVTCLQQDDNF